MPDSGSIPAWRPARLSPVMRAGDGLAVEGGVVQRHIGVRTAAAKGLELTARRPDQKHALATGMKEADASFTYRTRGTDGGERHGGCLLK